MNSFQELVEKHGFKKKSVKSRSIMKDGRK